MRQRLSRCFSLVRVDPSAQVKQKIHQILTGRDYVTCAVDHYIHFIRDNQHRLDRER